MSNAKFWTGICWLENMIPDWKDQADKIIQFPYAYCIHDKDLDNDGDDRKPHVHFLIAYNNTTTYNNVLSILLEFSADHPCINKVERVKNVRYMYDYLIHNTEDAKKKHKHLYSPSERVCGLNFDIGILEQTSLEEKREIATELSKVIISMQFTTYGDFFNYVVQRYSAKYVDVVYAYSSHFERLCRSCYLKTLAKQQ